MKHLGTLTFALLTVILAAWLVHRPDSNNASEPCTDMPCIELTASDGKVYRFNDFKLYSRDCIRFVSLPDKRPHDMCHIPALKWIGPENYKQKTI